MSRRGLFYTALVLATVAVAWLARALVPPYEGSSSLPPWKTALPSHRGLRHPAMHNRGPGCGRRWRLGMRGKQLHGENAAAEFKDA